MTSTARPRRPVPAVAAPASRPNRPSCTGRCGATTAPSRRCVLDGDVPAWLVLGYRELHQVTSDPELFSRDSDLWNQWERIPADWPLLPMIGHKQPSILYTVGERHRQRAAMISDALGAVDPFELRAHAERFADELIDGFCGKGTLRPHRRVRDAAAGARPGPALRFRRRGRPRARHGRSTT